MNIINISENAIMNDISTVLSLNSIKPEFIQPGGSDKFKDGWVHIRTTPYTALVQVKNGAYKISVDDKTELILPGETFLVGADKKTIITHRHRESNGRFYMESHWVHFHFSLHETIDLTSLFDMPLKLGTEYKNEINNLIVAIHQASNNSSPNIFQQTSDLHKNAFRILSFICRISPLKPDALDTLKTSDRFRPVFDYIKRHLTTQITPEHLAGIAHLSLSRFHHLFKEIMKCSPLDFVKKMRLEKARFLLLNSDMQVAEVAEAVGFTNQFHFSREFKNATNLAPTKFRQQNNLHNLLA